MNEDSRTDWKRVLNMTDAEVTANALKDPDSLPLPPNPSLRRGWCHLAGTFPQGS